MPKYLFQANYTPSGLQGLLKEGGVARRRVFEEVGREQGGSLESFYYAFGGSDLYMVFDLPRHGNRSGGVPFHRGRGRPDHQHRPADHPRGDRRSLRQDGHLPATGCLAGGARV